MVNCYASGEIVAWNETVDSGCLVDRLGSSGKNNGNYFLDTLPDDLVDKN